jgi:toxin ParE1/3/4
MKLRPINFSPAAAAEAEEAQAWYATESPAAASRFAKALARAIDRIRDEPTRWPHYMHRTRRYRLKKFPFIVVYRNRRDRIDILAVSHTSRRPGYWSRR